MKTKSGWVALAGARGLALAGCLMVGWAQAADITGTAYSIVVRNVDQNLARQARPSVYATPASGGLLRLVDVRSRREIARANWDQQLNGYFFQLPLVGLPSAPPICLALVDRYNRYVPVRNVLGSDPGTSFTHPRWDDLLGRSSELASLKADQAALQAQRQQASDELARLQADAGAAGATVPGSCRLPPPPPPPARPADALEPADAERAGGPLCALRWEQVLGAGASLGRLFGEAGLTSDWEARATARDIAERLPGAKVDISKADAALVQDAAAKGRTFLQHADGVRLLVSGQDQCRRSVQAQAERARVHWLQAVDGVRTQPERDRQACEARIVRIAQLRQADAQAAAYAAELERQLRELMRPASFTDTESIGHQTCAF